MKNYKLIIMDKDKVIGVCSINRKNTHEAVKVIDIRDWSIKTIEQHEQRLTLNTMKKEEKI